MNFTNLLLAQAITLVGLVTACSVVLHDTNVDKAFSSAFHKTQTGDFASDAPMRPSSNPHTHAEHLSVVRDNQSTPRALPRERNKRHMSDKRPARGYHGENLCLPLAGEWA